MKYRAYLKSDHWSNLRNEKLKEHPHCLSCAVAAKLHVHHINYKDLFSCQLADLAVLCEGCHRDFHEALQLAGKSANAYSDIVSIKDVLRWFRGLNQKEYDLLRAKQGKKPKSLYKIRDKSLRNFTRSARMTIRACGRKGYSVEALEQTIGHIHKLIKARKELDSCSAKPEKGKS